MSYRSKNPAGEDTRHINKQTKRSGNPPVSAKDKPPQRRTGCVLMVIGSLMLACLVLAFFVFNSSTSVGENGGGTDQFSSTATADAGSIPTQEAPSTETVPAAPTEEEDTLPPSDQADGQLWSPTSDNIFYAGTLLEGAWSELEQLADWEYEVLPYRGFESLFLMFDEPVWLVHPGLGVERFDLTDVELELQVALPQSDGQVGLVCRLQPNRADYYGLFADTSRWELVRQTGEGRAVLAEGTTSAAIQSEEYGFFRLRCTGDQLVVWDDTGLIASVQDSALPVGGTATVFEVAEGSSGQAYLLSERVTAREPGRQIGLLGETMQTGDLLTTFSGNWLVAGNMREPDYLGQDLLTVELRFENIGSDPIRLSPEMFMLICAGEVVPALDFIPLGFEGELYPLQFPVDLPANGVVSGEVLFPGLNAEDMAQGWQLVIDLREIGLGVLRFDLPQ